MCRGYSTSDVEENGWIQKHSESNQKKDSLWAIGVGFWDLPTSYMLANLTGYMSLRMEKEMGNAFLKNFYGGNTREPRLGSGYLPASKMV